MSTKRAENSVLVELCVMALEVPFILVQMFIRRCGDTHHEMMNMYRLKRGLELKPYSTDRVLGIDYPWPGMTFQDILEFEDNPRRYDRRSGAPVNGAARRRVQALKERAAAVAVA